MPITKSAAKSLRQNKKRHLSNLMRKDAFKEAVKAVRRAISAGQKEKMPELVRLAQQTLDKAAKTGVIKKQTASRRLSHLMNSVNAMSPSQQKS